MNLHCESTPAEQAAWTLYCEETNGDINVVDFWWELPLETKLIYLEKVANN